MKQLFHINHRNNIKNSILSSESTIQTTSKNIWMEEGRVQIYFCLKNCPRGTLCFSGEIKFHESLASSINNQLLRMFVNVVGLSNYSLSYIQRCQQHGVRQKYQTSKPPRCQAPNPSIDLRIQQWELPAAGAAPSAGKAAAGRAEITFLKAHTRSKDITPSSCCGKGLFF